MKTQITALMLAALGLFACKKQQTNFIPAGNYAGRFVYDDAIGIVHNHRESPVTVSLSGSVYTSGGNINRFPAGGSGSYTVGQDTITFDDTNVWTADFDWGLILHGKYNYHYEGDTLIMTKLTDWKISYQYRVKKN